MSAHESNKVLYPSGHWLGSQNIIKISQMTSKAKFYVTNQAFSVFSFLGKKIFISEVIRLISIMLCLPDQCPLGYKTLLLS